LNNRLIIFSKGFITRGTPIATSRLTKTKLNKLLENKELYEIKDIIRNYQDTETISSKETFKRFDSDFASVSTENENFPYDSHDEEIIETILDSNKQESQEKREFTEAKIKSNTLHLNKRFKKKVKKSLIEPFLSCYPVFNGNLL
jgi:hypothetical protein